MSQEEVVSGLGMELTENLPDHSEHLKKASEEFEKIRKFSKTNPLNDKTFLHAYEQVSFILLYVGELSQEVFAIGESLEEEYKMCYLCSPALGKKLFWQHYEKLHRPYTLLKNRCYRMYEELDERYERMYRKKPPNWNI